MIQRILVIASWYPYGHLGDFEVLDRATDSLYASGNEAGEP